MAGIDLGTIQQELTRRFAEPLPEFYKRRIIFWYDEDKEFEDSIDEISLDGVELVHLNGSNTFAVKKMICDDMKSSNFLVYDTRTYLSDDDNWIINVQLYSEEFRADLYSIWIDDIGLPKTPIIRTQVKNYRKFFRAKDRRESIKKLNKDIVNASQVHLAVMASLAGCNDIQPNKIIKSVLRQGLDMDTNSIYQSFIAYGADKPFRALVLQATGYNAEDDFNLGNLAIHILLTAATRTMHTDFLSGLERFISIPHQAYCYDFVSDWIHSDDNNVLYDIARYAEYEVRLMRRFSILSVDNIIDTEVFPCINECILTALMKEISDDIIQVDVIKNAVEKRRTLSWYDHVSSYYEGILKIADMQSFYIEHSGGFHTTEPHIIWKEYTSDYYRMDTYYRQFHICFQRSLRLSNPLLDDPFKQVAEKVEGLYKHWYLGQLAQNWSSASEDNLSRFGRILEVPQQADFFKSKVLMNENRTFVIISDALRYEVCASLYEQLQREMQCKVTLESCEALFPTVTKFGMAALLPHKKLDVVLRSNGILSVLADGQPTDANYRDKVLKSFNPKSVALRYDSIIGMKRLDRQTLVKGMDIVYIYHDKIDEASHTSDSAVFPACDDAIDEIKNMIRIIVNEFGGTNIFVTSDHGFLYTYSPLKEDDKVDKTSLCDYDIEIDRRYLITRKGAKSEYLIPVKFMDGETEYDSFAARENIRIKKKGGGLNFVHGGISLQEMVVPVLEFQYLRNTSKIYQRNKDKIDTKPVELSLISANRKISNMIFSLNFYQKEAVGANRESNTYLLYFVDLNGQKISDTVKIIADKANENAQERTFRCNFNLRSQKYSNHEPYYLVIEDENGIQAPIKEEFHIDIAFAVDEFNFF